jgi:tetratricopeptide (TPR) repeat protein
MSDARPAACFALDLADAAESRDREAGGKRSSPCPRHRSRTSLIATLAAALLGSVLLLGAVPRLVAALHLLPGDPGMALLNSGQLPSPQAYARIVASRRAAAAWLPAPSTLTDLGIAALSLAQASIEGRARLLDLAGRQLEAGLAEAPLEPHAWTYLAFIRTATGDRERAAQALHLALRTSPYQPELALPRAALGLTNWPWLDPDARARFGPEFAHALRLAPDRFTGDVLASGRSAEARAALAAAPAARRAFDRQIEELRPRSLSERAMP